MKRIILCISIAVMNLWLYAQDTIIGHTFFDLQTNGSCQNRIYLFDDGAIGATWTQSFQPYTYPDRGTGYNYFDGGYWQTWPVERIESQRSGWPSYAPLSEEGEIIISHMSGYGADTGLLINKRDIRGQGEWNESNFQGPESAKLLLWPRLVTGGVDQNYVYMLALTAPSTNGGSVYQGLNGALLYSRSTDGGDTWDIKNMILPGMDSTLFNGFNPDCYAFAEPVDNTVAFVVGSYRTDMFLMKSIDNGVTFEKTIIWDNPYDTILPADTLYCVDGTMAVALDAGSKAHVAFGITNEWYDGGWFYDRFVDGIGYWNEDMPVFSSNVNALNPAGGSGSEMVPDYNLIGWSQDMNGNGQIDIFEPGNYGRKGISSMPQLVIDEYNRIFLVYTSVTETYNNGYEDYRRLWLRSSLNGGQTWGKFFLYGNDNTYIFSDFIFPSCATKSDNNIYCMFFTDNEPSLNIYCENDSYYNVEFSAITKDSIVGMTILPNPIGFTVSQNSPNPFSQTTTVKVILEKPTPLTLNVMNLLGQKVLQTQTLIGKQGVNHITIEKNILSPGIYFYTVQSAEQVITRKMIIN